MYDVIILILQINDFEFEFELELAMIGDCIPHCGLVFATVIPSVTQVIATSKSCLTIAHVIMHSLLDILQEYFRVCDRKRKSA